MEQDAGMAVLVVLSGPPGIGKSTVGDAVAGLHPAVRLSIDDVEEAMRACGIPADATGAGLLQVVLAMDDEGAHRARLEGRTRPFTRIPEPTWAAAVATRDGTAPWPDDVLRLDAALPPAVLASTVLASTVLAALPPSAPPGSSA
jgi:hypothetical protein